MVRIDWVREVHENAELDLAGENTNNSFSVLFNLDGVQIWIQFTYGRLLKANVYWPANAKRSPSCEEYVSCILSTYISYILSFENPENKLRELPDEDELPIEGV